MPKKFLIISVIFLVIVGLAGAYIFKKQQAENQADRESIVDTSGWEIYRDKHYGFEVLYPRGASIDGTKDASCVNFENNLRLSKEEIEEIKEKFEGHALRVCFSVDGAKNSESDSIADWMSVSHSDIVGAASRQQDITFKDDPALQLYTNPFPSMNFLVVILSLSTSNTTYSSLPWTSTSSRLSQSICVRSTSGWTLSIGHSL
jgi:hypothetical protein